MIDFPMNKVENINQVIKFEQEDAQVLQTFTSDAKDSKSMSDAEGFLAPMDEQTHKCILKNSEFELMKTDKFRSGRHTDCDFLIKYSDLRNEAQIDAWAAS